MGSQLHKPIFVSDQPFGACCVKLGCAAGEGESGGIADDGWRVAKVGWMGNDESWIVDVFLSRSGARQRSVDLFVSTRHHGAARCYSVPFSIVVLLLWAASDDSDNKVRRNYGTWTKA